MPPREAASHWRRCERGARRHSCDPSHSAHIWPKYACRACEGAVVQAKAYPRLIEKGMASTALAAWIAAGKFAWGSTLYRQVQILAGLDEAGGMVAEGSLRPSTASDACVPAVVLRPRCQWLILDGARSRNASFGPMPWMIDPGKVRHRRRLLTFLPKAVGQRRSSPN